MWKSTGILLQGAVQPLGLWPEGFVTDFLNVQTKQLFSCVFEHMFQESFRASTIMPHQRLFPAFSQSANTQNREETNTDNEYKDFKALFNSSQYPFILRLIHLKKYNWIECYHLLSCWELTLDPVEQSPAPPLISSSSPSGDRAPLKHQSKHWICSIWIK